ncbi:Arginine-binding extracellular protein ArtP [Ensifer psoraleae]|uniref:transporter substrate-binding domain-containing protein n=1 Tax=Sinorhizobium psoraleae TaxID=520838 RepID=UPI001568255F|nr:transporter substrate-binding domain-containing protein [Sinorhizobium psoraleae]NRP76065.1 Arginine-binding extracellular protein ArtP [Sinorhizobium psoraleae]
MKKIVKVTTTAAWLAATFVASLATANAGEVLDRVLQNKTLTVAVGVDWGISSHLDENHQFVGYDIDIAKRIAEYFGAQVQFVTPAWDVITSGKWQGRWDLAMGAMTPTKARTEKFDFPATYLYGQYVVLVHKDSKATRLSDLDGKVVGVDEGTPSESYANHKLTPDWVGAKPIEYQFTPGAVKTYQVGNIALDDLRLGDGVRLDAYVADGSTAGGAIKSGYPLRQLGDPLFYVPGALAVLPGDKEFNEKIADAVKQMRDDGTLSTLANKWYGEDRSAER